MDKRSFNEELEGAYGVFSALTYVEGGAEAEVRQGKNIVDAAVEEGVQHFVYSSVSGAAS